MTVPRFLLDEHAWGGLVNVGIEIGVDVLLVQTQLGQGADDEAVLTFAANEQRVLLTSNTRHFAPLVKDWFLTEREHWGVIVIPGKTNKSLLSRGLKNIVDQYTAESLKNTYRFIQEFI